MSNLKKTWSEEDVDSIQRCPHDSENPYVQISNELIRDQFISPNCRWLIIYLLSNKGNWKIKTAQVINHIKGHVGRDKFYKILDEAMESGYILREEFTYRNLKRCRYFVSEKPKFKKILRHPEIQDPEPQDSENTYDKEDNLKKDNLKKEYIESSSEEKRTLPDDPPEIDDDDLGKNESYEQLEYTKTNGQRVSLSVDEVYRYFMNKKFATNVIQEAIRRFRDISAPVNNALKYIESTCFSISNELKSTSYNKKENKPIPERTEKVKEKTITFEEYFKCLNKPNPFRLEKS